MKHYNNYGNKGSKRCSCSCRNWPFFLLLFSVFGLSGFGFLELFGLDWIIDQQVAQKLRLVPGTDTFEKWKEVPIPIFIKFRLFNVTNPIEVQNGAKPRLVEAGPYVYEEKRVKEVLSMDAEKDTITYKQRIFYTFRPDMSNGSEADRLIVINVPFVTLSKLTYDNVGNFSFAHALADRNMRQRGERLFTFATVGEYLFQGYSVQHYLNFLRSPALALIGGVKIPKSISSGRFGFYLGKNGSDDGEYVIRTGKNNPSEFGQIISWNGKTRLDFYSGSCNLINGTDGSLVPPFLTKETRIRFFSSEICRSIYLLFREESEVKGVMTFRFNPPNNTKEIFNHKDFCFCPKGKNNECFKEGVLSMAPCRGGAPIAMSSAHFLGAYEPYFNGVEGLTPNNKLEHETYVDIEPKTGLILRAAKRIQFNVMVNQNRDMSTFSNIRSTMFPFMWVEEVVETTEDFLSSLQQQLFSPMEMGRRATSGGLFTFLALLLIGALSLIVTTLFRHRVKGPSSKAPSEPSSSRASSRSRSASISTSSSSLTSTTLGGRGSPSKSIGASSILTVTSRGTMTSVQESKSTMTEDNTLSKLPITEEDNTNGDNTLSKLPEEEENYFHNSLKEDKGR